MEVRFSIKNLLTIAVAVALLYIAYQASQMIIIAIFGFLFAYMLSPLATRLAKKMPYMLAAIIVLAVTLVILVFIFIWLVPKIYTDLEKLVKEMPVYLNFIISKIAEIGEFLELDLSAGNLYNAAMAKLAESGTVIVRWLTSLLGSVQHIVSVTINLAMVPVIACFVLVEYPAIQTFLDKYAGVDHNKGLRRYISLSSDVLSSYFRGQFTVMAILCVLYTIALTIVGLDAAVLLGTLTGLLSIVPYLGFAVGIVLSVLFAAVQFQDIWHPLYVILGYAVVQVMESFAITPKIVGDSVGLRPIATIIVLLISGSVFGIIGMIFALPITSIVFTLIKERRSESVTKSGQES